MNQLKDGPSSSLFSPLSFHGNTLPGELDARLVSPQLAAALPEAQQGSCVGWGIPFKIDGLVLLAREPFKVDWKPVRARWFIFMHTSDYVPTQLSSSPLLQPQPGPGRDRELAARYILHYADGTSASADICRNYQVGPFQRHWGISCYEAVAHHKPFPVRPHHEQEARLWGESQTRVNPADYGPLTQWLWAWQNPHPEKEVTGLSLEPVSGVLIFSAVSYGDTQEYPLRWQPRRKALFKLPAGEKLDPCLDENGLYTQVQLDLGQVISLQERQLYPQADWEQTYDNQLPQVSDGEVLVEYTCHPEACFHLQGGIILPVAEVEAARSTMIQPVAAANQRVTLRVVDKASGRLQAVKLHVHGETGEYLAPIDRHRLPNPAWFEDYGAEFSHQGRHPCTYIPGETRLDLPLGRVYLEVSKGFEIQPVKRVFTITPETRQLVVELEKVLPWRERGWVTADTHVHFLSPMTALLEGAGEGVNVVNLLASQWGELMTNVGDFDGKTTWGSKEAGGDGEYLVRVGTENRQHSLGHISLLGYRGAIIAPMTTGGPDESALGDPIEILLTEWARQCKEQQGLVVLPHFPYPHLEHAASIIEGVIDAVEMTSWEEHYLGIDPYSLVDWYRYLNCGYLVPAVGGTDKMNAATAVGTVRTYAHIDPQTPFSYETWKQAIRQAETFVSYGPLLDFAVDGKSIGSRFELPPGGGTLDVVWEVASATLPVSRVELVVNGEVQAGESLQHEGGRGSWSVKVPRSSWLALLVRGHYPDKPEIIAAHSSPVMVAVQGSPMFSSHDAVTILEQIEGTLAFLDTIGTRPDDQVYKRMRLLITSAHRHLHNRMHEQGFLHKHTPATAHEDGHGPG
jgi:hypothetical protein